MALVVFRSKAAAEIFMLPESPSQSGDHWQKSIAQGVDYPPMHLLEGAGPGCKPRSMKKTTELKDAAATPAPRRISAVMQPDRRPGSLHPWAARFPVAGRCCLAASKRNNSVDVTWGV